MSKHNFPQAPKNCNLIKRSVRDLIFYKREQKAKYPKMEYPTIYINVEGFPSPPISIHSYFAKEKQISIKCISLGHVLPNEYNILLNLSEALQYAIKVAEWLPGYFEQVEHKQS